MVRSMLYATDLGLYAPYVTQHALALARTFNAGLYVIHVVEPMGLFAESVLQSYLGKDALLELHSQGVGAFMEAIEQRMLDGFREEMGEGHQDLSFIRTVRVIQGEPSSVILEQAQKLSHRPQGGGRGGDWSYGCQGFAAFRGADLHGAYHAEYRAKVRKVNLVFC